MNFETGASDEVIDGDTFTDEALMHGLDVTRDGQNVWCESVQSSLRDGAKTYDAVLAIYSI